VSDYRPDRSVEDVADNMLRLHLTDIQFYDWAYRHADLLGGGENYLDALRQPIALATVRELVAAAHRVGANALGYAAVYGVGNDEWPAWQYAALLDPSGKPYALGDFLRLVDPADEAWLAHFTGELRAAADDVGFDGFHLDQYGYPKRAIRADGTDVSLAESFMSVIASARTALPSGRLVFNNVNDFPTWRSAAAPQDAIYVEVWPPHTTLGHLAAVVRRARAVATASAAALPAAATEPTGAGKPVVVAAYQHVYRDATAVEADRATAFTMATLFSHGATQLLCGEADRILVDPYYVRNHVVEASTAGLLKRWYDFSVEHVELLYDPSLHDVTGALAGAYNDDCDVSFPGVEIREDPSAGTVWRRIVGAGDRLVVHLVNLVGQGDTAWDAPRKPVVDLPGGTLRIRRTGRRLPTVRVADPDRQAALRTLPVVADGDHAYVRLPSPYIWQMLVVDQGVS
jgi:dextranase